jgi:hypothetical protein
MSLTKATFSMIDGGQINVRDFGADPTGVADSSAAIQAAIDYAVSSNIRQVNLGYGIFKINTTINFHTNGISFVGIESSSDQTGSVFAGCVIIWTGGASPMFTATTTRIRFVGFGVENQGTATDWLEMNSGAQGNTFENLYFISTATHTSFSRSVIRSNGNRMGYSQFKQLQVTSPAPVFLDVDGQGTANAMTPIHFDDRCIIRSVVNPMTFIKFTDETCEGVNIQNCTFIQSGVELIIFDSTTSPVTDVTNYFTFENNEIDADTADNSAWRFFKFTNVRNISFNQNTLNCGGTKTFVANLVNSSVSSCYGNQYKSVVNALFDADATSVVRAGYAQASGSFNQRPIFTTTSAGLTELAQSGAVTIDGRVFDLGRNEIVSCDILNNSGYEFRVDVSAPEFMGIGQVFTVVVRNVSGGAISIPSFNASSFSTSGVAVAPADGFNRSFTFYWTGTKAIEISRVAADVAN